MSKTRQKNHSEVDHWRAQVKKLKSENRSLKRRVKQLERQERVYEDKILEEEEPMVVLEDVEKCKKCSTGKLQFKDFKFVKMLVCDNSRCDYREKK